MSTRALGFITLFYQSVLACLVPVFAIVVDEAAPRHGCSDCEDLTRRAREHRREFNTHRIGQSFGIFLRYEKEKSKLRD